MRTVISGLRWATLGAVALHVSCSEGASDLLPPVEIGERPSAEPLRSACDFSQPSKQIVLAVADGPFGGKQDLVLVRADGASFVAHSFGADRATEDRYIYISGIEISVHGDHLLAERASDGAVVLDGFGNVEMIAPDLAAAKTFLESQGVELESDEEPVMIEPGEPPTVVIRQTLRTPLPDYRGEPYVNVEAVRGEWALLSSYSADRTWRVRLRTGEVTSIEKAIPANLRQFGFQQDGRNRLYFAFDDEGGFLASLRDDFGGGIYRSADGAHQWTRIGSAAREIDSIYGHGEHGTYVISAFATGPTTTWVEPPEDHEPMISGAFARLDRPSIGKSYDVPTNGTALSANGLCAAFLERAEDGPTLTMLNLETGARSSPEPRVKAGENLRWVALSP